MDWAEKKHMKQKNKHTEKNTWTGAEKGKKEKSNMAARMCKNYSHGQKLLRQLRNLGNLGS